VTFHCTEAMSTNNSYRTNTISILLTLLLLTLSDTSLGYECAGNERSTDTQRFDDNHDGTLTDIDTGLTWMRCALGQRWDGNTCLNHAEQHSWQSAQHAAQQLNQTGGYAGHKDWRVPKLPELAGITERHCKNPRINLSLFPATTATVFWTANAKPKTDDQAYAMDFGDKGVTSLLKNERAQVRLVQGGN
jgi:hypothetical protein